MKRRRVMVPQALPLTSWVLVWPLLRKQQLMLPRPHGFSMCWLARLRKIGQPQHGALLRLSGLAWQLRCFGQRMQLPLRRESLLTPKLGPLRKPLPVRGVKGSSSERALTGVDAPWRTC